MKTSRKSARKRSSERDEPPVTPVRKVKRKRAPVEEQLVRPVRVANATKRAARASALQPVAISGKKITIRVIALRTGYWMHKRWKEGAEFDYTLAKGTKLPRWVEPKDPASVPVWALRDPSEMHAHKFESDVVLDLTDGDESDVETDDDEDVL